MSQLKIKDGNNWIDIPAGGIGVPSGGTTGQVLVKSSNTDYATGWGDVSLEIEPLNPIVTKSEGLASVESVEAYQYGKLIMIFFNFSKASGTVNAGSNAFVGTLSGIPLPLVSGVNVNGFAGSTELSMLIESSGAMRLRVLAAASASGAVNPWATFGGLYLCA